MTNYNDTSSVWPGDADNNHVVDNNDMLPIGLYYYKIGPLRDTTSNIWQADSSANWGINQVGSNIKHIDCNGNGFIDFNDTMAIVQNFSFTHSYAPLNDSRTSYPDFYFVTGSSSYTAGSTVDAEIWLGTSSAPVTDLFGISFDISFNSALVQAGTVGLTYPSSWLGSIGSDAISLSKKNEPLGIAYGAITRTDGQNASGYGKIADLKFKVNSNISFVDSLHIGVLAYHAIDRGRNSKYFNPIPLGNFVFTGIRKEAEKLDVEVNPNPSTGIFHLYYPEALNNESKKVSVYNVVGEELFTLFEKDTHTEINLNEQPAGIYFLVVESKEGKIRKRVIKN